MNRQKLQLLTLLGIRKTFTVYEWVFQAGFYWNLLYLDSLIHKVYIQQLLQSGLSLITTLTT